MSAPRQIVTPTQSSLCARPLKLRGKLRKCGFITLIMVMLIAPRVYADTKIDPFLSGLYNAVNTLSPYHASPVLSPTLLNGSISKSQSGETMVDVILKTTSPDRMKQFIASNNGSTGTSINGIMTATVPLSLVPALVEKQSLTNIVLSRKLHFLLDKSVPAVQGDIVHNGGNGLPRPYTGKNVIIGIVDSGLDLKHPDLHYADGSTKVIALWDQTCSLPTCKPAPPQNYNYGNECTGYQINKGTCSEIDTVGHGTHVTGIAGSSNAVYTGMAPDAMLVIVKTDMTEAHVLDGINYIFSLASQYGIPAVVNISLGAQLGPHDDSSSMEQALDGFVTQATGRAVVVAAGNDGGNPVHLGFTATTAGPYASYFSVGSNPENPDTSEVDIDLWYNTASPDLSFALGVIDLSGNTLTQTGFVNPGNSAAETLQSQSTIYGYAQIDASNVASGGTSKNEVVFTITNGGNSAIDLTNSKNSYRYVVLTQNNGSSGQSLNAWIFSDNSLFDTMTTISIPGYTMIAGDTSDTVSFPATARYAIAVGSFVTKDEWIAKDGLTYGFTDTQPIGNVSFFSSRGPTPDPASTGRKPNITAPGEDIVSALSQKALFAQQLITQDGTHIVLRGTSMATPHVVGAIALLYDRNSGLDITDTINLLETSATSDTWTTNTLPNNDWGYGKLNALNLVTSTTPISTSTMGPVISNVAGTVTGISSVQIKWNTNKLSSSYVLYWAAGFTGQTFSAGTTTMTESHIVDLTNLSKLNSGKIYLYRVVSADPYGNTSIYPSTGGTSFLESSSNGCMCSQSNGRFNPGDLFPSILLLLGWFIIVKLAKSKVGSIY